MNFQDRRVKILVGLCVLLCLVVGYRIFDNIQKNKERAARINKGREVAVETALPKRVTIVPEMIFSGSLDPEWQAEVAPKVDGRIEKVFVKEGDKVTKGQVLATLEQVDIDAEVLKARSEYVEAKTNLRKAVRDLERYEKLYQAGAVSEQTVDDYRFAHENADAQLNAALGNLRGKESSLSGTNIVAPADGIIAKRYFQEGYYAKSGNVLFAIADISTLKTVINIPEGQIAGVAVGNEAKITLPAFENREIIGKITSIAPVADLPAHTFSTEISVDNPEGLRAGVFATVKLVAEPRNNVLTIPMHSIVMRDDQKTVYVVDDENKVSRRVLAVGYCNEEYAEILSGLKDGEVIVTRGQNKLREGSKIKVDKVEKEDKAGK